MKHINVVILKQKFNAFHDPCVWEMRLKEIRWGLSGKFKTNSRKQSYEISSEDFICSP